MPQGYSATSTFNPQQAQAFQQLLASMMGQNANVSENPAFQAGSSYLQNLLSGSPEAFAAFEQPYRTQFEQQTIPGLAERFAGLGAQSSSAFQNALGSAGAGLQEQLASLRSGLQMQALPQALGYAQQPFSNLQSLLGMNTQAFLQKQMPFWQQLSLGLAGGLGQGLGAGAGAGIGKLF